MCGLAGIVAPNLAAFAPRLQLMSSAIAHRGPDDSGTWSDDHAALVHRRLSIIDTSPAGHQPMLSHCGRYVMVYNGEIYNYIELRRELEQQGVVFRGHCDSEVLLAAFVAYGEQCLSKFNGMWAIAIWDRTSRRLFMARDRFGEKPLYYSIHKGGLLFASEIKAILSTGLPERSINERMLADFCAERVLDHTHQTFFRGISQLSPGTFGWWGDGDLKIRRYWQLAPDDPAPPRTDLIPELAALLEDAVRIRLRADTPVGTLLSGGLDSSGVTCIADRLAPGQVSAFSTIDRQPPEEAAGIDMVLSAHPGLGFHRDQPGDDCLDAELDACLWHQEEPFADGSMLAHFRLMRLARESGVRVLLTGQAADEVFAGYPGHLSIHLGGLLRQGRWQQARQFRQGLIRSGQTTRALNVIGQSLPLRLSAVLRQGQAARSIDWLAEGFRSATPEIAQGYAGVSGDPLNAALRLSITQRTLPGFLHYEDRNSMAFGVETRIPFLDHRLVSRVLPLSGAVKLAGSRTKSLLRQTLAGDVPPAISGRLAKQGYPAPLSRWLRNAAPATQARRVEQVAACPIIEFPKWQHRYQRFQAGHDSELPAVWRGLIVALWHARFIRPTA
jgi:asparagine synthase (glutamine-hydrolysing)